MGVLTFIVRCIEWHNDRQWRNIREQLSTLIRLYWFVNYMYRKRRFCGWPLIIMPVALYIELVKASIWINCTQALHAIAKSWTWRHCAEPCPSCTGRFRQSDRRASWCLEQDWTGASTTRRDYAANHGWVERSTLTVLSTSHLWHLDIRPFVFQVLLLLV